MIKTQKLTRKFGSFTAVDAADISIMQGEITGFIGLNGAGKTTTIKMLANLMMPTSGDIFYQNTKLSDIREQFLRESGIMLENMSFYDEMTVAENLIWFGRFCDVATDKVFESLEITGILYAKDKLFSELSKGMKQRMALASAIMKDPKILILDEPTSGLDPAGRYDIKKILKNLKTQNKTIFLSTHLLEEAEDLCTQFTFIHKGKIAAQGGKELFSHTRCCLESTDTEKASQVLSQSVIVKNCKREGNKLYFDAPAESLNEITRILVAADIPVNSIHSERNLEEFFMRITG